jgi:hypothetical protein
VRLSCACVVPVSLPQGRSRFSLAEERQERGHHQLEAELGCEGVPTGVGQALVSLARLVSPLQSGKYQLGYRSTLETLRKGRSVVFV